LAKAKTPRTVVAILLAIEAAVLFYRGATWIVPYPIIAAIAAGLIYPRFHRWLRIAIAVLAIGYAILFVFPGGVWMLFGSCGGIMGSTCSNEEFLSGVAAFVVGVILNFVAAFMLARTAEFGGRPAPPAQ
jgi:hypothetical protein